MNKKPLEKGVFHQIKQLVLLWVWICPEKGCKNKKGTGPVRLESISEGFVAKGAENHHAKHEREKQRAIWMELAKAKLSGKPV
jgi:hypothetical protein